MINFDLKPEPIKVGEVVVSGERTNANVTSTEIGVNKLEVKELQSIPVLLGEKRDSKSHSAAPGSEICRRGRYGIRWVGRRNGSEFNCAG